MIEAMSPPTAGRTQAWIRRFALGAVLALSAAIQFTVVARTEVNIPLRGDAQDYFFGAYNLQQFGVYSRKVSPPPSQHPAAPVPDKVRAPGYSLFLAASGPLDRDNPNLRRIEFVQAGLGVLSVLLAYLLARRFLAWPWAIAASLVLTISPHLAVINTYILSESLFYFLLLAALLVSVRAAESRSRGWALAAGALWAATALVRPTTVLVPLLPLALSFWPSWRTRWLPTSALMLAGFLLVYAPWPLRNLQVERGRGDPNLTVDFLIHGSYPNFRYRDLVFTYGSPYRWDPYASAASRDLPTAVRHIAQEFRQHPGPMLRWYLLGKPGFFLSWMNIDGVGDMFIYQVNHSPYLEDRRFDQLRLISYYLHWPLMLLGVLGAIAAFWRPGWIGLTGDDVLPARLVAGTLAYAIAFHMIGAPYPRYGIPFRPLAVMLGIAVLARLGEAVADRGKSSAPVSGQVRQS